MTRKRKVVLQNDHPNGKKFAERLLDKGYSVMLKYPGTEEIVPYPF